MQKRKNYNQRVQIMAKMVQKMKPKTCDVGFKTWRNSKFKIMYIMNISIIIKYYPILILLCFAMMVRTEFKTLGRFQNMALEVQNMAISFSACFELSDVAF